MSERWDTDRTRHFAGWLAIRRRRGRLGTLGHELATAPSCGEEVLAFVQGLLNTATATEEGVDARFMWRPGSDDDIPYGLIKAMLSCQKPFQLWDVERVEVKHRYQLEAGPELRVGGAAALREEDQIPRSIETSSRALQRVIEVAELSALSEQSRRRSFARLLRDPLPFGVPDPASAPRPAQRTLGGFGTPSPEPTPAEPAPQPRGLGSFPPGFGPPSAELPPGLPPHVAERLAKKRAEQQARREQQQREKDGEG